MQSPPSTLGQYQIIREIARSNDIVYEAYDPLMNRRVAVKELNMPQGATPQQAKERIDRFKREAQAAGTLNHPNIMTVYSFAEDQGRIFMAMEFLDGHSLRNEIDTKGLIPQERAVEIAVDTLDGLSHAHSKGVIHRDIKPDNIQILANGEIKITDFGIARLTFQPNLTMDGQVFGTPSYMSPEQVVGRDIDARSDIFSMGVVLFEMLAGQKPFTGDSVVSISYSIMNRTPSQPAGCPMRLWQVIERALEKSPAARFQSAGEMRQAILDAMSAQNPMNVAYAPPDPYAGHANPLAGGQPIPPPIQTPYGTPNPYAQPGSMPGVGPGAVPGPITTPYNPYGQAPPPQTYHYGHAYPSPYMQQQQQAPYGMPPPGPLPIYVPPPPRPPLFRPETREFFKQFVITVAIVGTLLTLIAIGIMAIADAIKRYNAEQQDRRLTATALEQDSRISVEERIRTLEEYRAKLISPAARDEANRNLAVLYEELGKKELAQNELAKADATFQKAIELDPRNAALHTNLGGLYEQMARMQGYESQQAELYRAAAESWATAARNEVDRDRRSSYRKQTASLYLAYADRIRSEGDIDQRRLARSALYDAMQFADDADIRQRIQAALTSL